jgi:hypothetical protein
MEGKTVHKICGVGASEMKDKDDVDFDVPLEGGLRHQLCISIHKLFFFC